MGGVMSFLTSEQANTIKEKLVSDPIEIGKLYRAKNKEYQTLSVDHSLVDDYLQKGWEVDQELKTKTKIKKKKSHSKQFEDDIWCQFYNLGFRTLNRDETLNLPFGTDNEDKKQIDIIAVNDETVFLVECKSSLKSRKAPSYKDEFDLLRLRIDGFRKAITQLFGKDLKMKYIFATRNLRLDSESEDMKRLEKAHAFYYNDNTYTYYKNDGEVGRPGQLLLELLIKYKLNNVLLCVSRIFGGIKLGVGGVSRAFKKIGESVIEYYISKNISK